MDCSLVWLLEKSTWGKYLALYSLKIREFCWLSNLHACFANIAKLKALIFRKPILPFFLGLHNHSQFIRCIFLLLLVCPPPILSNDGLDVIA